MLLTTVSIEHSAAFSFFSFSSAFLTLPTLSLSSTCLIVSKRGIPFVSGVMQRSKPAIMAEHPNSVDGKAVDTVFCKKDERYYLKRDRAKAYPAEQNLFYY